MVTVATTVARPSRAVRQIEERIGSQASLPSPLAGGVGGGPLPEAVVILTPSPSRGRGAKMRKAASGKTRSDLSHGQRPVEPPTEPLSAKEMITDNAPQGSFPTSLLNHETSDHLLSRLEPDRPFHRWPRPAWTAGLARKCESFRATIQALHFGFSLSEFAAWARVGERGPLSFQRQSSITRMTSGQLGK